MASEYSEPEISTRGISTPEPVLNVSPPGRGFYRKETLVSVNGPRGEIRTLSAEVCRHATLYPKMKMDGPSLSNKITMKTRNKLNKLSGMRLAICGPSGIAKSIIMKLLKLLGVDPKRVRKPRPNEDPTVCMDPTEFNKLKAKLKGRPGGPLYKKDDLRVYPDWSIFRIRGKDWQALPHQGLFKDPRSKIRVEIFAPVLTELLHHHAQLGDAFSLQPENTLVILLNPTSTSYRRMTVPTDKLRAMTEASIRARFLAQGTKIGETEEDDISKRVCRYLDEELEAWTQFWDICSVAECKGWSHFEAMCMCDATGRELLGIKRDILRTVAAQAPAFLAAVRDAFKSDSQIRAEARTLFDLTRKRPTLSSIRAAVFGK